MLTDEHDDRVTSTSDRYYFHAKIARQVLCAMERGDESIALSIDLNMSHGQFVLARDELILAVNRRISRADLQMIEGKRNRIFCLDEGQLEVLESRDDGYCKLVPTDHAPLLEISGVKMHISMGIAPNESASQMAAQVVSAGDTVLDTCAGLGYSSSAAIKLEARAVTSVEKSEPVIELRERNPWSRRLNDDKILIVHADIGDYIREISAGLMDSVIHDPPRFSLAGELYGGQFYRELFRVMKRPGALFHYTGNPHQRRGGVSFVDQVAQRLKEAGFSRVVKVAWLMGVVAHK